MLIIKITTKWTDIKFNKIKIKPWIKTKKTSINSKINIIEIIDHTVINGRMQEIEYEDIAYLGEGVELEGNLASLEGAVEEFD